ncbi:UNVERIFIED_CONTAM: Proline-rich receptor-like protein kinase PERK14 [Sesamum latifolium]|uniref:Proline-rich receptor-like protein kinase PERK14 n=1 Tax=Sesamum latifolium TaxID=2727402 RepID=A0AAW2V2X0_9LAMI
MPKKMGVNSKAEAARARKTATEADRKDREAREKEEQYWREAEGAKSRAAKKREEEAEKRAEAAAKKAEARRLAEQEAKDLEKSMKKPDKKANRVSVPVPKVTEAELIRRREEEQAALRRRAEEDKKKQNRIADEEEYERMVSVVNTNRDDSVIEARTVEEAIARMTVADTLPVDKHPEKRLKASFKAFEEAELPKLKEEKPGLTHTQYKDMIWKLWKKSPDNPLNQKSLLPVTDGNLSMTRGILCRSGTQAVNGRRIIVGLKSDNCSREMLLRACSMVVVRGDSILAVHVEQSDDTFDPNTFHIHEDLCKSKQVDFEIKICTGSCYITELSHLVRVTFATILVVGCSRKWPKDSMIAKCQKALPPTCQLLVIDNGGKIIFRKMGTSQQGSASRNYRTSLSSISESSSCDQPGTRPVIRKFLSMPSSSTASTPQQSESEKFIIAKTNQQLHYFSPKFSHRLAMLEVKGHNRRFTVQELNNATESFGANVLIGEGAHSRIYQAILENGQAVAVKVLKTSRYSEEIFFQEVDILSGLKHKNIVQLLGHCYGKEMLAIVYNLHSSSLKLRLSQLKWSGRIQIALGVAKALEYLHSCCPPIIHKAVNSYNILLSEDGEPHLSGFGAAKVQLVTHRSAAHKEPAHVIETGHLAPEYVMYGKVDEKIDVYSYGVVLLELITGKEAVQTSPAKHQESLVLWARSLLTCGLYERLIDPSLNGDYKKEEMKAMMNALRLCLLHSSSRRPTMRTVHHLNFQY